MREDWIEIGFKDVVDKIATSNYKVKQKDYLSAGDFPIIDQGQELIGGFENDEKKVLECDLPLVVFGDHTRCVKYINFQFIPGADGIKVLVPKLFINPKYLFYVVTVLANKIENKGYARHYQLLEKQFIALPPLPEQRAIVKKLESLFSSLDAGVADLKKPQQQLKIYRQAVLKKAFEGEFEKVRIGNVLNLSKEKHKPEKTESLFYIGLEHIEKHTGRLTEKVGFEEINTVKNKFNKDDILYGKLRPNLNKVYLANESGVCSTDMLVFTPSEKVVPKFVMQIMLSRGFVNDMSNNTSGVNLPRVSTKNVENYLIPLPNIDEQKEIVKQIESRLSVCDSIEQNIKESLEKAEALRQSILKKAFEGKLLTEAELAECKLEKDYEPAGVLLERIKAERNKVTVSKKKTKIT